MSTDLDPDHYLDVYAKREPDFDGMEHEPEQIIALKQWREGRSWEDPNQPDSDNDTDKAFFDWYAHR